jgi:two-component system C4-dicarboxylate transport sensor histidine kinase DctB
LTALRTLSDSAAILLEQDRKEDVHGNLQRITRLTDRLARLSSQLKTFAHKSEQPGVPVALAHCLTDAQATVDEAARQHGVQIEIDVQPPDQQVLADEAALCSVLVNLMRNAIEAMQSAPERKLRVRARGGNGGMATIELRDTGPGIAPEILPRLFEPFVTSKPAGAGLGLGLVISAQLMRGMQGSLRVCGAESSGERGGESSGACFVVELKAPRE